MYKDRFESILPGYQIESVDVYSPLSGMFKVIILVDSMKKLGVSSDEPVFKEITIACKTKESAQAVLKVLHPLYVMGNQGSSRGMQLVVMDGSREDKELSSEKTGFDGDGSDRIWIMEDGERVKDWDKYMESLGEKNAKK